MVVPTRSGLPREKSVAKFLFNLDSVEELEITTKMAGFKTKAQTVRRALLLYRQILEATAGGKRLYVGASPTEVQPLIVIAR